MEQVFAFVAAILYWRVVLSLVSAALIGGLVAFLFPNIGPEALVVSLLAGVAAAMIWQSSATNSGKPHPLPEPPISTPVAAIGFAFVGAVWGGLATGFFQAPSAVLFGLALSPFILAWPIGALLKRHFVLRQMVFASCALAVGFFLTLAIHYALA